MCKILDTACQSHIVQDKGWFILNNYIMKSQAFEGVAMKLFGTSHRIDCENNIQTIVTMDPSP